MLNDYRERGLEKIVDVETEEVIITKAQQLNLTDDCPRVEGETFQDYISRLYTYMMELEGRLISNSLHVFGETPKLETQVTTITEYLKVRGNEKSLPSIIMQAIGEDETYGDYASLATRARKGEPQALKARETVDEHTQGVYRENHFRPDQSGNGVQHHDRRRKSDTGDGRSHQRRTAGWSCPETVHLKTTAMR